MENFLTDLDKCKKNCDNLEKDLVNYKIRILAQEIMISYNLLKVFENKMMLHSTAKFYNYFLNLIEFSRQFSSNAQIFGPLILNSVDEPLKEFISVNKEIENISNKTVNSFLNELKSNINFRDIGVDEKFFEDYFSHTETFFEENLQK